MSHNLNKKILKIHTRDNFFHAGGTKNKVVKLPVNRCLNLISDSSILFLALAGLVASGCRKKPDLPPNTTTKLESVATIKIDNVIDNQKFWDNTWYKTHLGDSFLVYYYKYYISNIKLHKADGNIYSEVESYHLIENSIDSSKLLTLNKVPVGNYTKINFLIGVDSIRNVSGAQTGALDPINGMFWDWDSGYLTAMMDGEAPSSPNSGMISYHISGFKGRHSALRWITLDLPKNTEVSAGKTTNIHLTADVAEWFKNPSGIRFSEVPVVNSHGEKSAMMADNYKDMFKVDHVD